MNLPKIPSWPRLRSGLLAAACLTTLSSSAFAALGSQHLLNFFQRSPWNGTGGDTVLWADYLLPEQGGTIVHFAFQNPLRNVNVANPANPDASAAIPVHPLPTPRGASHAPQSSAAPASPNAIGSAGPQSPIAFPSGVVHLERPQTPPDPRPVPTHTTPGSVMAPVIGAPIIAPRPQAPPKKSSAGIVIAIVVLLLAIAGGAAFALMHRWPFG
jgi:hypothetical protein